jgi:hypothetical protein
MDEGTDPVRAGAAAERAACYGPVAGPWAVGRLGLR